jgi:hypothetical protein
MSKIRGAGVPMRMVGGALPIRRALVLAIDQPTPRRPPKVDRRVGSIGKGTEERKRLAGHIRWLDANRCMSHAQISAFLGTTREFVYRVLELGVYRTAVPTPPPAPEAAS